MTRKTSVLVCGMLVLSLAIPAVARSAEGNANCDSIGALARQLAEARDKGMDEQELLKQSHKNAQGDASLDAALGRLITMTYAHPELTPDQIQSRVLDGCYKKAGGKSGGDSAADNGQ